MSIHSRLRSKWRPIKWHVIKPPTKRRAKSAARPVKEAKKKSFKWLFGYGSHAPKSHAAPRDERSKRLLSSHERRKEAGWLHG